VRDTRSDTAFDIRTRAVLNAAGPWAGALAARFAGAAASTPAPRLSRAMNLVVPRVTRDHACGGIVDGRYLFMVPWRDVSIVGTSHDPHDGGSDAPHGGPAHVDALLRDAQVAFPKADLNAASVRLVHRGLLPMTSAPDAPVALLKESAVVDHGADGCPGLVSLHSVRYTTARPPAVAAVDAVARALGLPAATTPPAALRLASARFATVDALVANAHRTDVPGTTAPLRERLARTYGDDWTRVAARVASALAETLAG
jgi:glycerol-3-phosphate dehydrogenase